MNLLTTAGLAIPSSLWLSRAAAEAALAWAMKLAVRFWPGVRGEWGELRIHPVRPCVEIRRLRLDRSGRRGVDFSLAIDRVFLCLSWRDLLKKRWVGSLRLERPRIAIDASSGRAGKDRRRRSGLTLQRTLRRLPPFELKRWVIRDGAIRASYRSNGHEAVWDLTQLRGVVRGIASLAQGPDQPVTGSVAGRLPAARPGMPAGTLEVEGTWNPFALEPTFDLDVQARGVELSSSATPLWRALGIRVVQGSAQIFAEAAAAQGYINGYLKLIADGVRLRPAGGGLAAYLRFAWIRMLAGLGAGGGGRLACRIPFDGEFRRPLWHIREAAAALLRHAFGRPILAGLEGTVGLRPAQVPGRFRIDYAPVPPGAWARFWGVLRETVTRWIDDGAPRFGAALSYYTAFSMAPLLILVVAVASFILGPEAARGELATQLEDIVGAQNAQTVQHLVEVTRQRAGGATIVGLLTLLLGGTVVLAEIKQALNRIWRAPPPSGVGKLLMTRLKALLLVLAIGALLILSVFISTALAAVTKYLEPFLPIPGSLMRALDFLISQGLLSLLFAFLYKGLPDAEVEWDDVAIGAVATALLFTIGKTLLGSYLGGQTMDSYGAAGSILVLLLWVYYSAQVFYLGAEFTAVYAERHGSRAPQPER